jgi:DNA primase
MDAEDVKRRTSLLSVVQKDAALERIASTGGGEYAGACPFCGGEDRFRLQLQAPPGKKPQGERWICRQCSPHWGDVIGYIMKRDNVEFQEAMEKLAPGTTTIKAPASRPTQEIDREKWKRAALEFIEQCACNLWTSYGKAALNYLKYRGLKKETLIHWAIGYNPTEGYGKPEEWGLPESKKVFIPKGITIPCLDKLGVHFIKIRRRTGDPKYFILKGGEMWLFGADTYNQASIAFIFEGEFDALLAWQTTYNLGYGAVPAGQEIKPNWQPFFEGVGDVIIAYDTDDPGQDAADKLCRLPGFHKAEPYPIGKDLGEYYLSTGSHDDVFFYLSRQVSNLPRGDK